MAEATSVPTPAAAPPSQPSLGTAMSDDLSEQPTVMPTATPTPTSMPSAPPSSAPPSDPSIYDSIPTMNVGPETDAPEAPTVTPHIHAEFDDAPTVSPSSSPAFTEAPTIAPSAPGGTAMRAGASTHTDKKNPTLPGDGDPLVGKALDGYQIREKIGAGGMGAVYRAHQNSLDRDVALKVLPEKFARNPDMIARFTREALSAAQLSHHNVIQVYDVGKARNVNFITMELVNGQSLGELIRSDGRLTIEDAASYGLQTARGLAYAHDLGIIHRDIKPANLMINDQGVVKIADMGLAKRIEQEDIPLTGPDGGTGTLEMKSGAAMELTQASVAMGTPAYMAPEQGKDAATVDGRADQYSLGCTLYFLCTGKAPYTGKTAQELITKHTTEPPPPLNIQLENVPALFEEIVDRMLAKKRDERYPTLKECIRDLETFLGIESDKGTYTPREQHLTILEAALKEFYEVPAIKRRKLATRSFFALMLVLGIFSAVDFNFALAGGALGLMMLTPLSNFIIDGIASRAFLFRRVRSLLTSMSLRNWGIGIASGLAGAAIFWLVGWLPVWIGFGAVGVGMAFGYQFGVLRPLRAQREGALQRTRDMLKELRVRGVSEDVLHDFVTRFAGRDWEEFFEELFGYEDMMRARTKLAVIDKGGTPRRRYAAWRGPLVAWIERLERVRRDAKEKNELARVEKERLQAQGVDEVEAEKQAIEEANNFQEQTLHKMAAKDIDWTQHQAMGASSRKSRERTALIIRLVGGLARAGAGLGVIFAYAWSQGMVSFISLPSGVSKLLSEYIEQGYGDDIFCMGAGVLLFLSAFSKRTFAPWILAVGVVLFAFLFPAIEMVDQPQFNENTAFLAALGLIVFGFGLSVLGWLGKGGEF